MIQKYFTKLRVHVFLSEHSWVIPTLWYLLDLKTFGEKKKYFCVLVFYEKEDMFDFQKKHIGQAQALIFLGAFSNLLGAYGWKCGAQISHSSVSEKG